MLCSDITYTKKEIEAAEALLKLNPENVIISKPKPKPKSKPKPKPKPKRIIQYVRRSTRLYKKRRRCNN